MSARQADGLPLRDHLERAANQAIPSLAARERLANIPTLPVIAADVWAHFISLHNRRAYTMDGPQRFAWNDIQAYQNVTGLRLNTWQLRAVFAIEDSFFAVKAEAAK